ncbi:MAG: DUF1223 domain-containing protein [Burkholderiales bacterium]
MSPFRLATTGAILVVSMATAAVGPVCTAASGRDTLPLVELYTSEGCDSCPPVDRWLTATFPARDTSASVLAFHVDYWDRLGWKDRFASADYTARQYASMRARGATFVYTPQVLVQGRDVDAARRLRAVDAARVHPARATISMEAEGIDVRVRAGIPDRRARRHGALWVAYTDSGLVSDVKAGENRGVQLRHDHVVRALYGPFPISEDGEASAAFAATQPAERGRNAALVAFVQDRTTGEVLQTLTMPICKAP